MRLLAIVVLIVLQVLLAGLLVRAAPVTTTNTVTNRAWDLDG